MTSTIGVKKIQYPNGTDIMTLDSSGSLAIADSATVGGTLDVTGKVSINNTASPTSYYGDELVSSLRLSSGVSDDPLFTFKLKATKEAPLKVVFIDNFGKRWEASKKIKFKG